MDRTPVEVFQIYLNRVWNGREVEYVREICADPITRHFPDSPDLPEQTNQLSHDQQIARISARVAAHGDVYRPVILHGDKEYATVVWDMTFNGGSQTLSGIEVFRIIDGRITDVWNSTFARGLWT